MLQAFFSHTQTMQLVNVLETVQFVKNTEINRSLGVSPYEKLFGRKSPTIQHLQNHLAMHCDDEVEWLPIHPTCSRCCNIYIMYIFRELGRRYIYMWIWNFQTILNIYFYYFFFKYDHRFSNISRSIFGCLASLDEIVFI